LYLTLSEREKRGFVLEGKANEHSVIHFEIYINESLGLAYFETMGPN
jgi:hypothetical protein